MRFLLAADEAAEHGAESAELMAANWLPAVTALVVFLLAFGFLYIKVWPKIVQGLEDRDNKIRQEIESAEQAREQAKAALAEYERSLASAREEANAMIVRAKADAKAAGEQLRASNEAELSRMKQRATRDIEAAKTTAISELYTQAAMLSADIAAKVLAREMTAEDQQRLINQSLEELGSVKKN
ncbi:MAG: F0F1 ATP synthase subunit B [Planctomycetes bacterium]|nr:F0F1 ATP synthase subunit B [Planctomycetota bacterium]